LPDSELKIDLNSCLAVNPGLVLRIEDDDCALLFDPDNGKVQMFNSTAVAVWQLLDGKRTLSQVLDSLGSMYEGVDDSTAQQVIGFMENLAKLGAVGVWEQD
jgi:hypothetical protein